MAQLVQPFNANNFDPTQSAGSLPVGKHKVIAYESEVKATKDNTSGYLQFMLRIIEGPLTGQTGPVRFNLYNSSNQAAEIANKQFSAMCHCVAVFDIVDSQQLHNIPFMVEVQMQKDGLHTEIKKFFDVNGNEPGKKGMQAPAPAQQQQPPAQQPAPAWGQQPAQQAAQQPQQQPAWGAPAQPAQQPAWGQPQQQPAWGQPHPNQPQEAPQQQPAWGAPAQQPAQGGAPGWGQPQR